MLHKAANVEQRLRIRQSCVVNAVPRQELRVSEIEVGSLSSLAIKIPVLEVGQGPPTLTLLCGLHGDETLGLLASHRLLDRLVCTETLRGCIRVIPVANPFAQALGNRVGFSDFLDLNRIGPGDAQGSLTERVAAALYPRIQDSSLVVDLHEFEMETPLLAILIPSRAEYLNRRTLRGIAAFEPRLMWVVNPVRDSETHYGGSLIASLIASGVPAFAIEAWAGDGPEGVAGVSSGLWRVAQHLAIVKGDPPSSKSPLAIRRRVRTADSAGVWQPQARLLTDVETGGVVGSLTSIDFRETDAYLSDRDGVVIQVMPPRLVHTGTGIFAVGEVDACYTERLRHE